MRYSATPILIIVATAGTAHATPEGDIYDREIVDLNDNVSFVLKGVSFNDEIDLFTTANDAPASVQIANDGTNQNVGDGRGNFDVLVNWKEFFETGPSQGEASRIRFEVTTSSGDPIIPQSDFDNGFNFVRWEMGAHSDPNDQLFADAIDFRTPVEQVVLVEATAVFFSNQTVLNTVEYAFTIGGGSDWDGTDSNPGNIFTVDSAVNRIQITYDYTPIPAPASAVTLAGAGLLAGRRRRQAR